MDFLLKRSKAGGLPQLSSQQECNQSPNSTAPNTTNCRLHQEINNLSVTEKWHLTAKGRLARSALRNLSFRSLCCTCSVDNESTSGSRTVTLTSLTGSESCGSEGIVCVWTFLGVFFWETWLQLAVQPQYIVLTCNPAFRNSEMTQTAWGALVHVLAVLLTSSQH